MQFFINGSFCSQEEARLSVLDLGLVRGYAVFDYLRTYQKKPFHLNDHLERFRYSAQGLGLTLPYNFTALTSIISQLIEKSSSEELSIKLFVTGGESPDQLLPTEKNSFIAFTYPLKSFPKDCFTQGIKATTTSHHRTLPYLKTTNYLEAILALQEGRKTGALESLYLNEKKQILEGTTTNFFAIKDGVLLTPPEEEILLGITRNVILRLCQGRYPIEIRSISYAEIGQIDEAFISASNKEIMPVTFIDNQPIGTGKVGPLTQKIMSLFYEYTGGQNWSDLSIPRYNT